MHAEGGSLYDLIGHSITYRVIAGPRAGQKLFTLQAGSACAQFTGRQRVRGQAELNFLPAVVRHQDCRWRPMRNRCALLGWMLGD